MPLKIIGAFLLLAAGLGFGCTRARRLTQRREFLGRVLTFISCLSTELRYRNDDIFSLVNSCGELFQVSQIGSSPFYSSWRARIGKLRRRWSLTPRDTELLDELGSRLGTTDSEGQLTHLAHYKALFERQLAEARADAEQKTKLYKTLGLFAGVSAAIMLL